VLGTLPSVVGCRRGGGCSLADVGDRPSHWFFPTGKYVTISPLPLTALRPGKVTKRGPSADAVVPALVVPAVNLACGVALILGSCDPSVGAVRVPV
jgi:hypothetical protein